MILENYPVDRSAACRDGWRAALQQRRPVHDTTHYPLSLIGGTRTSGCSLRLQYRPDLFERQNGGAIGRRLERMLEAVVAEPNRAIGRLDLLEPEERRQLLVDWNATEPAMSRGHFAGTVRGPGGTQPGGDGPGL